MAFSGLVNFDVSPEHARYFTTDSPFSLLVDSRYQSADSELASWYCPLGGRFQVHGFISINRPLTPQGASPRAPRSYMSADILKWGSKHILNSEIAGISEV